MTSWLQWIGLDQATLWWIGILSVVSFVGILIATPIVIVRLPRDYFTRHQAPDSDRSGSGFLRSLLKVVKNGFGVVLMLAGLAMLLLPGQGILTILVGLFLMDFPGKQALERRIVQRPAVARAINWTREKANRPPLEL